MKGLLFILMVFLAAFSVNALIGHVYTENIKSGDSGNIVVTFFNPTNHKEDGLQVTAYVPDLGIFEKEEGFVLRKESSDKTYFMANVPKDAEPGYYPIIVTLENDDGVREKKHSWVYIG